MSTAPSATTFAEVDGTLGKPQDMGERLSSLKDSGLAPTFNTLRLAPRLVSQNELDRVTGVDPELLLGGAQFDYKGFTFKTVGASSVLGLLLLSADFLGDTVRFSLAYAVALIPVALLAIGSTAPGLLTLPAKILEGKQDEPARRVARHEAGHLLIGYALGLAVESYSASPGEASVQFAGEENAGKVGVLSLEDAQPLLVVGMAGMLSEYGEFGDSDGGRADLMQMQRILSRVQPRIPPEQQQGYTRWAALMAWSYLQTLEKPLEAATDAIQAGKPLSEVLAAVEGAKQN